MTTEAEPIIPDPTPEPDPTGVRRGRPAIGAIAGFLLGLFLAADLLLFGAIRLDNWLILVLPVVLAIAGFAVGWFAPLAFLRRAGSTPA